MIGVNQSAALILTNVGRAKQLNIPRSRWVYLHGAADANDIWHVSERDDFVSSPALRWCADHALKTANVALEQVNYFDIYSCFPSAVEIACDELGIKSDDPRGLSLTGGLPYFGGPGNNYSMHAIAEMMDRLRANPGDFGLLNANGWFLTKHSVGIYSTEEPSGDRQAQSFSVVAQNAIGRRSVEVIEEPNGQGTIETFTVLYDRRQRPVKGIIIGRTEEGNRFLANTPQDPKIMNSLIEDGTIGRAGRVSSKRGKNTFMPD
jgi:acetyl-CoA C-acetyltransferase